MKNYFGREVLFMPRGDGTGPMGFGPMTGRGAGYCAGFAVPGYANPYMGMGMGRGRGRGRGYGRRFFAPGMPYGAQYGYVPYAPVVYQQPNFPGYAGSYPDDEKEMLKEQAAILKEQLDGIVARLDELEGRKEG
jgi:hypothetical protein